MSKATKRKHVTREVLEELVVPSAGQMIVRVCMGVIHAEVYLTIVS